MTEPSDLTVRDVARRLREPMHRVKYAIGLYGIEPARRVGIIRLFSRDQLPRIAAAVRRVRDRRGDPGVCHA